MKVVCIKHFKSQGLQYELTYGKIYECTPLKDVPIWVDINSYYIKCDRGFMDSYHKNSFMLLEDWREQRIDNILESI